MAHVIDGDYVRMGEHGDGLRLGLEAAAKLLVPRQLVAQYLHSYRAVQAVIGGFIHHRHAAGAYGLGYLISVIQGRAQIFIHIGVHGCLQTFRGLFGNYDYRDVVPGAALKRFCHQGPSEREGVRVSA